MAALLNLKDHHPSRFHLQTGSLLVDNLLAEGQEGSAHRPSEQQTELDEEWSWPEIAAEVP